MDLSLPYIHMCHIIPISILCFWAAVGSGDSTSPKFPAELDLPIHKPCVTVSSRSKEVHMEHIDTIYGLNNTNTLYSAHGFDI